MNCCVCMMGGDSGKCACDIILSLIGGSPCLTRIQYLYSFLQYQQLSDWKMIAWIKVVESCTESIKPWAALPPTSPVLNFSNLSNFLCMTWEERRRGFVINMFQKCVFLSQGCARGSSCAC